MTRTNRSSFTRTLIASAIAIALLPSAVFAASPRARSAQDTQTTATNQQAGQQATQTKEKASKKKNKKKSSEESSKATNLSGMPVTASPLRLGMETAQTIKRNSDAIVDVTVAQDIGKLPDETAAESLARVTGVQGYRGRGFTDNFNDDIRGGAPTLSNVVLVPGKPQRVQSLVKTDGHASQMVRSTNRARTNTYPLATGAHWYEDNLTWSTDLAYTQSGYGTRAWGVDSALTNPQTTVVNFMKNGGAAFSLPNFDVTDPNNCVWRGFYESRYHFKGSGFQWRGDLEWGTDYGVLPEGSSDPNVHRAPEDAATPALVIVPGTV